MKKLLSAEIIQTTKKTEKKKKKNKKNDNLFNSQINFQLWGLFSMHPQLSLSELAKKLGKSKSTIHPYVKDYLEREIIEIKEEKQIRGNIKAKIYGFKQGYHERIFSCEKDSICLNKTEFDKELGNKMLKENIMKTKLHVKTLQTRLAFFEKLLNSGINGPDERAIEILKKVYELDKNQDSIKMFKRRDILGSVAWNSEKSHLILQKLLKELLQKFNELTEQEEKDFPDIEKPYHYITFGMPLKLMMEYLKS